MGKKRFISILITTLIFLLLTSGIVTAQSSYRLQIDTIDSGLFPKLGIYVSVSDVQGLPVKNLAPEVFSVLEDGLPVTLSEVTPIQNTKTPLAVVLLIDTSASMGYSGGTPLRDSIAAGVSFVQSLNDQDSVAIVSFSSTVKVLQDLTTDKLLATTALNDLEPENDTAMYDAIYEAAGLLKNRSERKLIILVTDGVDSGISQHTKQQAIDEAVRWSVPVFPVGFSGAYDSAHKIELEEVANATGGSSQIQLSSDVLKNAFGVILQILREQYMIIYTSALSADNQQHSITVKMDYQGWYSEDEKTYLAYPGRVTITPNFSEGETVSGIVRLAPQIESPGDVVSLEISLDGSPLKTVSTPPFEYQWDSQQITAGDHLLAFTVTDVAGNVGESSVTVNVQPALTITISQPQDESTVSGQVEIMVEVTSYAGISRVDFSAGGQELGSDDTAPYQFSWDASQAPTGRHMINITAIDSNGLSDTKEIFVNVETRSSVVPIAIVSVVVLVVAGILIPIAIRKRRKTLSPGDTPIPMSVSGGAFLRELKGLNADKLWSLDKDEIRLGRRVEGNDIPLLGKNASREHAIIRRVQNQYMIYTLNPANPVLVNQKAVPQSQILQSGDIIQLGDSTLSFEVG